MENELSPHNPNLNLLDFFSSGELARKTSARNTPDLKAAVEAYVQIVTIKTCRNITENISISVKNIAIPQLNFCGKS